MDARKGIELLLTPGVTPSDWEQLGTAFRDAERTEDVDVAAVLGRLILSPVPRAEVKRQCEAITQCGARLVFRWEPDYPPALQLISMAPPALFLRGALPSPDGPAVAIVGTRKPSTSGIAFAHELARTLSLLGVTIVSGMARGIDTAAHRGALAAGASTIAVLGTGVDVVYPPENGELMDRILATGGIVSEQVCGMQPFPQVFPKRNRIISGLCDAVVVVEGGARSGALITARWALEQGRDVGAVPGFPGSFRSEGPNLLLKEGAFLVEDAVDVVANVKRLAESVRAQAKSRARGGGEGETLDHDTARVFNLLGSSSSVDDIATAAGISVEQAQSTLTLLEIDGRIRRDDAGHYARIAMTPRR